MKPAWTAIKTKARKRRFSHCSGRSHFYWHKLDGQRVFKSQAMPDASFEAGQSNDGTAGQLTASSHGIWYMYDQRGNLSVQGQTSTVDNGFAEYEKATHYYWLPNEFGDILVAFDQDGRSFAVYTDHINTPRLVTLVNNPLNPVPLTDTSNDLAQTGGDAIQGISPLAMPVWQMAYSPFGVDLANGYEAKPTTINNNFKTDLWEWLGLPTIGGAGDWSWYAGGGNGLANGSVLTAPVLNIRYPGQYYDAESGLSQNWWRSYDARMGRYTQNDPIGLEGGMNRFGYAYQDGINQYDPYGLWTVADLPTVPQPVVDFSAGAGDALLFGTGGYFREEFGFDGSVDVCSDSYGYGSWASLALGVGRLGYAVGAKVASKVASSGAAASAARNALKERFRFGAAKNWRPADLSKYGTDDALRRAAGRTNKGVNGYGAGVAGAAAYGGCTCRR